MTNRLYKLLFLLLLISSVSVVAQDLESVDAILNSAKSQLMNIEFEKCIENTVNALTLLPEDLYDYSSNPQVRTRVIRIYEYRSIALFNLGQYQDAEKDFINILELAPGHKLSEELAAAKLISRFENVRSRMVGYLTLNSTPFGAVIFQNERIFGQTNVIKLPLKTGSYSLLLQLPGYQDAEVIVNIHPGKETVQSVDLVRTDASLSLRTHPTDVEVYLDGKLVGTTSGKATEDHRERALSQGLNLTEVSGDFLIRRISLGIHKLEFKKSCYEDLTIRLPEITTAIDYNLPQIFQLNREEGQLKITSAPPMAQIYLNAALQPEGKYLFDHLCAGQYQIEVVSRAGRFSKTVVVNKNEITRVAVDAKPGLLLVSSLLAAGDNSRFGSAAQAIKGLKDDLKSFSVLCPEEAGQNGGRGLRLLARQLKVSESNYNHDKAPANVYAPVKAALLRQKARLLMLIEPEFHDGTPRLRAFIFNDLVPYYESVVIDNVGRNNYKRFLNKLNYVPDTQEAWIGIKAVDTRLFDNPVIISIQPDSPAARSGLELKSRIVEVNGFPVNSVDQFIDRCKQLKPGENLNLKLNFGEDISRQVLLEYSPVLISDKDPELLYSAILAHLGTEMDGVNKNAARFNTAISLMHFGAFEEAGDLLKNLRLGSGPGINQGTVYFYLGKCFEGMGFDPQALENYLKAGSFRNATLESHNGPLLKYEVVGKIKNMGAK